MYIDMVSIYTQYLHSPEYIIMLLTLTLTLN